MTAGLIGLGTFLVLGLFAAWLMYEAAKGNEVVRPQPRLVVQFRASAEAALTAMRAFARSLAQLQKAMIATAPAMRRLSAAIEKAGMRDADNA